MDWIWLAMAGLLEIVWAYTMKLSDGFTRGGYTLLTLVVMAASFGLLSMAMKSLPLGTAYAIWTGIGAVGTVIVGVVAFDDPLGPVRAALLFVLVAAMVGLKLSGDSKRAVQPSSGRGR